MKQGSLLLLKIQNVNLHIVKLYLYKKRYIFAYIFDTMSIPELSFTEENYLKAIYYLQQESESNDVSVNDIAERMNTRPATVTDMMRKLSEKNLINYEKYKRTHLSTQGTKMAVQLIRRHRLWEVFLHSKLQFSWDEVHEVAEELEHIRSSKLIERLDEYLDFPKFDPHGDPIPTADGTIKPASNTTLSDCAVNKRLKLVAVKDTSSAFLQHMERFGLNIGAYLSIVEMLPFDKSMLITVANQKNTIMLSSKITDNLLVVEIN